MTTLITASIPYINAPPHLGYAYELVQTDIAVRARQALGEHVRFHTGTDDNSLKNVLAAEAAGRDVRCFVDDHAEQFVALHRRLGVGVDEVVRTSGDPRHLAAVTRIWNAAAKNGDLYRRTYGGLYCVGCEQYLQERELDEAGHCSDHARAPEWIEEENWFFRLSQYEDYIRDLISSGRLAIEPEPFKREVLSFVETGLEDISVSRSAARARGWGIPVPDDPSQVIYVWFDALTNYLSGLDWGSAIGEGSWAGTDERVHVIGKGILRFHAVYWPAFLASAGEPPPTTIRVHPYLTIDGRKISKSGHTGADPEDLINTVTADGVRWYFARDVYEVADTDVTLERIIARVNDELANGIGNAVNRVTTLAHRNLGGVVANGEPDPEIASLCSSAVVALANFEQREGSAAIVSAIDRLNATISETRPWEIAKDYARLAELSTLLGELIASARRIAEALTPVCPAFSQRLKSQLTGPPLPPAEPTFPRIET